MDEKDFTIPSGVLSDLCSRFIINVPEEERTDLIRIFFQIEIAHWFYLDFYCDSSFSTISTSSCNQLTKSPNFGAMTNCISPYNGNTDANSSSSNDESSETNVIQKQKSQLLKPCSIRTFAENIFRHCPFLMQHTNQVDDILSKWKVFKHAVPTNGAIILDESMRNVLLVQGFWAKASWGFPKGKVVEEESEAHCAQREVLEETGYDISDKIKDDQYLEIQINDQTIRLYIITGVSKTENFEPRTRREIKDVKWFSIDELPVHRKDLRTKQTLGYSPNAFFMVIPFLKALKQWIFANNRATHGQSGMINSNSSGKLFNRSQSTINHPRQNGHHHHHHHHGHTHHQHHRNHNNSQSNSSNNSMSNSNQKLSKSNENLSSSFDKNNNSVNNNSTKKISKKEFEAQHRAQLLKQQANHYQKMQQNDAAEFFSLKEAAKANKQQSNHPKTPRDNNNNSIGHNNHNNNNGNGKSSSNHFGIHSNSKFKPVQVDNQKQIKSKTQQNNQTLQSNITFISTSVNLTKHNEKIQNMNQVKKHLEFNGPECWINFKFDLNSLTQDLPPLYHL